MQFAKQVVYVFCKSVEKILCQFLCFVLIR